MLNYFKFNCFLLISDKSFADQVLEKYYNLYQNGLIQSVEEFSEESAQSQESYICPSSSSTQSSSFEEELIRLVSERPPLYDHRLPLKERSRTIVKDLWTEIIQALNGIL